MAINKSQTPTWVKVVIIVVVVAFVGSVPIAALVQGAQNSGGSSGQFDQTTTAGGVDAINAKYSTTAQSLQQAVASNPESYTALVNLGNTYMDWAGELSSQATTAAAGAALPLWTSARDAYDKALKIKAGESAVEGDYAITLFNLGDTKGAITRAEKVVAKDPKFGPMWFNLGIFYVNTGQNDKALKAFQEYLKVDPQGSLASDAQNRIKELQSGQ